MKPLKQLFTFVIFISLFTNCSSAQKLQNESPIKLGDAYSQTWVSGVKGGGSGLNLFIPTEIKKYDLIRLDSVYFRGKVAKLEIIEDETLVYVGRFKGKFNQKEDRIIDTDNPSENNNKTSEIDQKIPFDLKDSECVVSFKKGNETKYFKIEKIVEKQPEHYPSAPPNRQ